MSNLAVAEEREEWDVKPFLNVHDYVHHIHMTPTHVPHTCQPHTQHMPSTPAEEGAGEGSGLSQWPGGGPSLAGIGGSEDRGPS